MGFKPSASYETRKKIGPYKLIRRRQNIQKRRYDSILWHHIDFHVVFFSTNMESSGSRISAKYDVIH